MRRLVLVLICLLGTCIAAFGQDTVSPKEEAEVQRLCNDVMGHPISGHLHHRADKYEVAVTAHMCAVQLARAISDFNGTFLMNGLEDAECRRKALSLANMRQDIPV